MSGSTARVVHQDYIVRQRYSNALPPPPGAPKLLDLPLDGMKTYTMPVYAERMHRAQPLNIEADAFLGMPIDLVGMPGIFEGDESSIQAPLVAPAIHPRDRLLLRPLKSLGKKSEVADISFLRRTQYVAEDRARLESGGRNPTGQIKRRKVDISKEDPVHILRSTIKGFDIANPESAYTGPDNGTDIRGHTASFAEKEAWKAPKHPTKPNLKVVDSYPLVPDPAGLTDDNHGGYAIVKFLGNPTDVTTQFDERLETSLLRALEIDPEAMVDYTQRMAAHKANPDGVAEPALPTLHYELFLPGNSVTATSLKRKRDVEDPERDSSALYTDTSKESQENDCFKLNNVREYETGIQTSCSEAPYQEVALALYDPEIEDLEVPSRLQKAAYFYPIVSKTQLKPRRAAQLARLGLASQPEVEERSERIDAVNLTFREPDEEEVELRAQNMRILEGKAVEATA